jgi:hypothetical protein
MEIWIIRDGEKTGPFHDFEIRRKIETGELPGDTHAWHEGQDAWKPLSEIEIFTREFEKGTPPRKIETEASPYSAPRTTPPPLPAQTHYIRRFWARWFDLMLYASVWWFGMWAARQNIDAALQNPWLMFFQFIPWFIVEILLIHYAGTTPGKWLLGLSVTNNDDSPLDLPASTRRSLRVLFTGIGFGWGLLAIFCQTLSVFTARRLGNTLWDHLGGHRTVVAPLSPFRVITFVVFFIASLQLQSLVLSPYLTPYAIKIFEPSMPGLQQEYEKNPPWHLPLRSKKVD